MNILHIEDERNIRKYIKDHIESMGHQCISCDNCEDGLEMIRKQKFDLIFLDLTMPTQMQGDDLIDILNKTKEIKKLNIVVFSGQSPSKFEIDNNDRKGVKKYIDKPMELNEVTEIIQHYER